MKREEYYTIFETDLGPCALSWGRNGVKRLGLPEKTLQALEKAMEGLQFQYIPQKEMKRREKDVYRWIQQLQQYFKGARKGTKGEKEAIDLMNEIPLDFEGLTPFLKKVYQTLRENVPFGKFITYGELGNLCGLPKGARAIGMAMGRNPFPIIVPCHRVIASSGKLCGFSAYGGLKVKERLLDLEGIEIPHSVRGK